MTALSVAVEKTINVIYKYPIAFIMAFFISWLIAKAFWWLVGAAIKKIINKIKDLFTENRRSNK